MFDFGEHNNHTYKQIEKSVLMFSRFLKEGGSTDGARIFDTLSLVWVTTSERVSMIIAPTVENLLLV